MSSRTIGNLGMLLVFLVWAGFSIPYMKEYSWLEIVIALTVLLFVIFYFGSFILLAFDENSGGSAGGNDSRGPEAGSMDNGGDGGP